MIAAADIDRRVDAGDMRVAERGIHTIDRFVARRAVRDDLREQRVVERRNREPRVRVRIDAHAEAAGKRDVGERPSGRREVVGRFFRVDAALDRVPVRHERFLIPREPFARGDADLLLDEIHAVEHLAHGVLDLDPRVHLHEIHVVTTREKFEGPGASVAHRPRRRKRHVVQLRARLSVRKVWRRRLFDQLLVRGLLHGAVPLAHVDDVAEAESPMIWTSMWRGRSISFSM